MKYIEAEGLYNPLVQLPVIHPAVTVFRGARLAGHLAYGLLLAGIYPLLGNAWRRALLRRWSCALLRILHVRLELGGFPPQPDGRGILLVANHISWLDVFAINAANPSCFVAKSEVRSWPFVGALCRLTHTIFIDRSLRRDTARANRAIAARLSGGECVALFPEGTSTDGSHVRHFHASLLQCAVETASPVQPVAIRYHDGSGLRTPAASYSGDMTFMRSLLNVLHSRSLHVTLLFLPQVSCCGKARRAVAEEAYGAVNAALEGLSVRNPAILASSDTRGAPCHPDAAVRSVYSLLLHPLLGKARRSHHY